MAKQKHEASLMMGRIWGRRWIFISLFIIILTGVAIYFFDETDDSKFTPLDARPPAFKDQHDREPVQLINMPADSQKGKGSEKDSME